MPKKMTYYLIPISSFHKKGQKKKKRERETYNMKEKRVRERVFRVWGVVWEWCVKEEKWKWGSLTFVFDWLVYQTCLMKARTPVSAGELLVVYPLPRVCVYLGEILRGFLWLGVGTGYVGCTNLGGMGFGA